MAGKATVTYFHHSGFMVSVGDTLMVFDYWRGERNEVDDGVALNEKDMEAYQQVLFFVSHDASATATRHDRKNNFFITIGIKIYILFVVNDCAVLTG